MPSVGPVPMTPVSPPRLTPPQRAPAAEPGDWRESEPAGRAPTRRATAGRAPAGRAPPGPAALAGLASLATAGSAGLDLALTGRLSIFFDLCFVLIGLVAALAVRADGFFTAGVLPPLLLGAVVAVLAATQPDSLTATHVSFVGTFLTGLAHHAAALVVTHLTALLIVGGRIRTRRRAAR